MLRTVAARKRVDRLRVVADDRDAAAVGTQERDDVGLQRVRVLVLVDEHGVEALRARGHRQGRRAAAPEQQQVVVVEHVLRLSCGRCTPRRGRLRSSASSLHHGNASGARPRAASARSRTASRCRGTCPSAGTACPCDRDRASVRTRCMRSSASDRSRIVKSGGRPIVAPVQAQEPRRHRVERAAPDRARRRAAGRSAPSPAAAAQQPVDPPQHLLGGAAREGEQQDAARVGMPLSTRYATRCASVAVLPVPAPATIRSGPLPCDAAARCAVDSGRAQERASADSTGSVAGLHRGLRSRGASRCAV